MEKGQPLSIVLHFLELFCGGPMVILNLASQSLDIRAFDFRLVASTLKHIQPKSKQQKQTGKVIKLDRLHGMCWP